jgi:hypothetical protein
MKKFAFPLYRVLDWRRAQLRLAEIEMERLHNERRSIEAGKAAVSRQKSSAQELVLSSNSVDGAEFLALDTFGQYADAERARFDQLLQVCAQKIGAHAEVVIEKRRDVHLIEKLKEKRLATWTAEATKEISQLAEETYLARWKPRG